MTTVLFRSKLHSCDLLVPYKSPLRDFKNVLFLVWKRLGLPEPTPVQYDIADFLQHGPDRAMVEAFRGVGKSWLTCTFADWCLLLNPQLNIEIVSAAKDLADNNARFMQQLINDDELAIFTALKAAAEQRNSFQQFDVGPASASKDPSVKSVGIFGQITGTRADLLISDDVEVPRTSETQAQRDKLAERVKEYDAILKPGGKVLYLGTPQCEQSVYRQLPERGYTVRIWPSEVPGPERIEKDRGLLAPFILKMAERLPQGAPVDPRRFSQDDLERRRISYGRSSYSLQFLLDTSVSDADRYPLKVSDLMVMDCDKDVAPAKVVYAREPQYVINDLPNLGMDGDRFHRPAWVDRDTLLPYSWSCLFVDPSGRGQDELTWGILKQLHGYLFLLKLSASQQGYSDENLSAIAADALEFGVKEIVIEANFGDGMFSQLLQPHLRRAGVISAIEEVKVSRQKELRIIDTLEPVMNQHRLIVDRRVIEEDYRSIQKYGEEERLSFSLVHQLTRITRERGCLRHDDRVDGVSLGVARAVLLMAQDANLKKAEHERSQFEKELEKFVRLAKGHAFTKRVGLTAARPL